MSASLRPGLRVSCKFGHGVVVRLTGGTALVALSEMDGLKVSVPLSDIELIESAAGTSQPVPDQAPIPSAETLARPAPPAVATPVHPPLDHRRLALEALRFGLVPAATIEDLTIGYDNLASWVERQLPGGDTLRVSEICGPFGTGKSHTMAVVRHVAAKAGFLTARVEIDGKRVSLADPKNLLANLWPTLEGRELRSNTPLVDIYRRAIERGCRAPTVAPHGIDRVHRAYVTIEELMRSGHIDAYAEEIESILCCDGEHTASSVVKEIFRERNVDIAQIQLSPMIGIRIGERPIDFLESIIGTSVVAKLAGFAGVVITIDEFEIEDLSSSQQKLRVERLLGTLLLGLRGEFGHPNAPLGLFFASVGREGHVGDQVMQELIAHTAGDRFGLQRWPAIQLRKLGVRIRSLYEDTYRLTAEAKTPSASGAAQGGADEDLIRAFIKACVAELDASHGPPQP